MSSDHAFRGRIYPAYTSLYTPGAIEYGERELDANARALLARMLEWLPANRNAACLDVACGAGGLLFAMRSAGYEKLSGVDCSGQQVSVAQQICPAVEHSDAVAYLQRHKEQFDLITAMDILEHFDKNEVFDFVDALFAALKPGGRLIVQTPNAASPFFGTVRYGDLTHEMAFTPQSLAVLLRICGFSAYQAKECRPFIHGIKSGVRAILWSLLRSGLALWNLAETGSAGDGVFTRVFVAKADKPE